MAKEAIRKLTETFDKCKFSNELLEFGVIINELSQVPSWKAMAAKSISSFPIFRGSEDDCGQALISSPDRIIYYTYNVIDLMIKWNLEFLPKLLDTMSFLPHSVHIRKLKEKLMGRIRNDSHLIKFILHDSIKYHNKSVSSDMLGLLRDIDVPIDPAGLKISALAFAIMWNFFTLALELLDRGADINQSVELSQNEQHQPLFFLALSRQRTADSWFQIFSDNQNFKVKECINALGQNALHHACYVNASLHIIFRLIDEFGVNSVPPTASHLTPLFIAAKMNHGDLAVALLNLPGVDFDLVDEEGHSLPHLAVKNNSVHLTKLFLRLGKEFNVSSLLPSQHNRVGQSVIGFALMAKSYDCLTVLVDLAGIDDINRIDNNGCTLIILAILNNDTQAVQILIRHPDIDCNIPLPPWLKQTTFNHPEPPLFLALRIGNLDIVTLLAPFTTVPSPFLAFKIERSDDGIVLTKIE